MIIKPPGCVLNDRKEVEFQHQPHTMPVSTTNVTQWASLCYKNVGCEHAAVTLSVPHPSLPHSPTSTRSFPLAL